MIIKIYIPHHNTMVELIEHLDTLDNVQYALMGTAIIIQFPLYMVQDIWFRGDHCIVATGVRPEGDARWCEMQEVTWADRYELEKI